MTPNISIATPNSLTDGIVIIGIDPGLACTGIGIILRCPANCTYLAHSVIRTKTSSPLSERLAIISRAIKVACVKHNPAMAAVERTFVNQNFASSLALSHARGAALAALGECGLCVAEIAPNTVKRQLTGDGLACKAKVAKMVFLQLSLPSSTKIANDASDALAIALSFTVAQKRIRLSGRKSRRK